MRHSLVINNPVAEDYYTNQGFTPCEGDVGCRNWLSPEEREDARQQGGTYTCPQCQGSFEPIEPTLHSLPAMGNPGGYARSGLKNTSLGHLGEHIVFTEVASRPEWKRRYGEIVWHRPGLGDFAGGGAGVGHPVDGISVDPQGSPWAIEVKAADAGNVRPGFNLGKDERASKHAFVEAVPEEFQVQQNLPPQIDNLLGVCPLFDFEKSLVHIWVKEMQRGPWKALNGKTITSWGNFFPHERSGVLLLADVPFKNPYMDPMSDSPWVHPSYGAKDDGIPF